MGRFEEHVKPFMNDAAQDPDHVVKRFHAENAIMQAELIVGGCSFFFPHWRNPDIDCRHDNQFHRQRIEWRN